MVISVEDLQADFDHYLELVGKEEILIARDNRLVAKLLPVNKGDIIRSLQGILPPTVMVEEAREERLAKHTRHWNETE